MPDGDMLPETHHVLRYCFSDRFSGGNISEANFAPRPNRDKGKLSTVWVECRNVPEHEQTLESAKQHLLNQIRARDDRDEVCMLNVAAVTAVGSNYGPIQIVEDWGKSNNKRHTSIGGLTSNSDFSQIDFAACAALARLARKNRQKAS